MKMCIKNNEVTFTVNGRKKTLTEQELTEILEEHFSDHVTIKELQRIPVQRYFLKRYSSDGTAKESATLIMFPEDFWGVIYYVDPLKICQELFKDKREDADQEKTRQLILDAFAEMDVKPERYAKKFSNTVMHKTWESITVAEMKEFASEHGGWSMTDWVELALEWAQKIANGEETWESLCNEVDDSECYRAIIWKNGKVRLVGSSFWANPVVPQADIGWEDYDDDELLDESVIPMVTERSIEDC